MTSTVLRGERCARAEIGWGARGRTYPGVLGRRISGGQGLLAPAGRELVVLTNRITPGQIESQAWRLLPRPTASLCQDQIGKAVGVVIRLRMPVLGARMVKRRGK